MFESSLIDLDSKKKSRRAFLLPVALAIHIVGLGSVAFASYWNVGEVAEPSLNLVFVSLVPPPAPPPAPPPGGPVQEQTPVPDPRPVTPETPVQPDLTEIPDEVPEASPIPQVVDLAAAPAEGGEPGGVPGGVPDGVLGGDPDGVPGGVPNGTPDGAPDGVPGGLGDSRPVHLTAAMVRPQVLKSVAPRYTEMARRAGVQGAVRVEAIIDEQGRVTNVRVLRALPMGLDRAAVEAVEQWRFQPATLDGRPIKVYFSLTVTFTIQR
ncbi:MAG TPA: energy transducer TonB [Thermoanaerobaculia bacterium]|nr:energy transducer TonB [Thermoanaerobaculia bacterium]